MQVIQEESTSPDDYIPPKPGPTQAEQWNQMAATGNVRGLLDEIQRSFPGMINYRDFGEYLQQALAVLARSNPAAFAEFLQADIMAATGPQGGDD